MSPFFKDLTERVLRTFLQAALVVVAANLTGVTDLDSAKALGIAAATAGLSAITALFAKTSGSPDDASFLPPPA
jgi:hypothetical protein